MLTFLPGERVKTVSVDVLGDTAAELTETFSLVLSNPTNARLRDGRGIGTILDDDGSAIFVADASITEANATVVLTFPRVPERAEQQHDHCRLRNGRRHGDRGQRLHREDRNADVCARGDRRLCHGERPR